MLIELFSPASIIPELKATWKTGTRSGHLDWFLQNLVEGGLKKFWETQQLFFYFIFFQSTIPMLSIPGADSEWEWVLRLRRSSRARPSYLPAAETRTAINQLSSPSLRTPSIGGESSTPRPGAWQCWYLGPDMNMRNGERLQDKAPPLGVLPSHGASWPILPRDNGLVKERRHVQHWIDKYI